MKNFGEYIKEGWGNRASKITLGGIELAWEQDGMDFILGKPYDTDLWGIYNKFTPEEVDSISKALNNGGFKYSFVDEFVLRIEFNSHDDIVMQYVEVMSQGLDI